MSENQAPKKIIYSYTHLSTFERCPRQFKSKYLLKDIEFIPNEKTQWGKDVHDALDVRLKSKEPLHDRFKMYEPYAASIEKIPGKLCTEYEMAVDTNGNRVGWWDKSAVKRGKADVIIFNEDKALIADWKTGKYSPSQELQYFSLLAFKTHPALESIKTMFLWFKNDGPTTKESFTRSDDFNRLEDKFEKKIFKIEEAIKYDHFPANKSGLCKNFCGSPTCKFSGRYNGSR